MEYKRPFDDVKSLTEYYGEPGNESNLVFLDIPYPLKLAWNTTQEVNRIRCHKKIKDDVYKALHLVFIEYNERIDRLKLNVFGGCFNKRPKVGSNSDNEIDWSTHAWGIALDFDPIHNKNECDSKKALFAQPEYDRWFEIWRSVGFYSLGKEKNRDWMHLQAAVPL
jgi:hypothetical protein